MHLRCSRSARGPPEVREHRPEVFWNWNLFFINH